MNTVVLSMAAQVYPLAAAHVKIVASNRLYSSWMKRRRSLEQMVAMYSNSFLTNARWHFRCWHNSVEIFMITIECGSTMRATLSVVSQRLKLTSCTQSGQRTGTVPGFLGEMPGMRS
ncbi:JM69 [macacine gammaherpesvirus 11]|uniref:JM69 n=2 Tax=macacine gammaherpesvirus 11 TaxID=2560570 RepID=G9JM77_9GAMA|nr:JM69 [Macaca fuscata rhadinovirus]AAT00046.1 JM69 [Macaca fuscata rhadinovirus]AEW87594.1 JM69 [Macaca fuscata rhadinovirus]AEW87764.1 JM69 [Macaca fuscata rhadinovirus]